MAGLGSVCWKEAEEQDGGVILDISRTSIVIA